MAEAKITVGADTTAFNKALKSMQTALNEGCTSMTARLARLGQAMNSIGTIGGAAKSVVSGIASVAKSFIAPAATAEKLALSFEVMLGSETKAIDFMAKLEEYAAKTPFAMNEISAAAKQMLANTSLSAEEAMKRIEQIGNISAMTGASMMDLVRVYAKGANVGITNEVAESFETMGVAVRAELADVLGIAFSDVKKLISEGLVSFNDLNYILERLTTNGGKFAGGTERLALTFDGLASTLEDNANMALQRFGEHLLPEIKPVIDSLIQAIDNALPTIEHLGVTFAEWLGDNIKKDILPNIGDLATMFPRIGIEIEHMADKAAQAISAIMGVIEPFKSIVEFFQRGNRRREFFLSLDPKKFKDGREMLEEARRLEEEEWTSADTRYQKQLANLKKIGEEQKKEAKRRRLIRYEEAQARDELNKREREAAAEKRRIEDENHRKKSAQDRAEKKAVQDKIKAEKEALQRLDAYRERRAKWEQKQADKERERMSITKQRRQLTDEAERLGVEGVVSPESIRARLDALAAAGAKSNEKEIADLEHLLERWDALTERKKNYVKMRAEAEGNLRADALEASGRHQAAARLREEMETARRIEELKNAGFSARRAADIATAESTMRRYKSITEKIQNARVEFIQGHQAAEGGGGVSIRVGGATLEQVKEQTRLQKEMRNLLQRVANRNSSSNIAVLA